MVELSGGSQQTKPKSEAQMPREKRQLEAEHRRQNDMGSSPVAVDFSDYFDQEGLNAGDVFGILLDTPQR